MRANDAIINSLSLLDPLTSCTMSNNNTELEEIYEEQRVEKIAAMDEG